MRDLEKKRKREKHLRSGVRSTHAQQSPKKHTHTCRNTIIGERGGASVTIVVETRVRLHELLEQHRALDAVWGAQGMELDGVLPARQGHLRLRARGRFVGPAEGPNGRRTSMGQRLLELYYEKM